MRYLVVTMALAASGARAESDFVVRPLLGISGSASDSGLGLGAQIGVRVAPLLLRLTLDIGGNGRARDYICAAARAGWIHVLDEDVAVVAGLGFGWVDYGFILDDPAADVRIFLPEVGFLFGHNRWFGRAMIGATAFVPLETVSHARDRTGQEIGPPRAMVTLLLSL